MLASLLSPALAERPDHDAIATGDAALSFRELAAAADRLAGAIGAEPGERVAVVGPNVPALAVGMLAAWRAGAVAVPLSARLRRFELERAFADARPAVVLCAQASAGHVPAEEVQRVARAAPAVRRFLLLDELGEPQAVHEQSAAEPAAASSAELAAILSTSGTTGEPKGALVGHAMAEAMGRNMAELLGDDADAATGLPVPASHAFGLGCMLAAMTAGATLVIADVGASVGPLMGTLRARRARVLHSSPALLGRIHRASAELLVRTGFVAGSLCPPGLLEELDRRGVRILNLYGMTEIGAATSCRAQDPLETRARTVGRPLPGYELRVEQGEIQVRSPLLATRYHGRPWGPDDAAEGGWFRTGDLGTLDPAGNLTIAGRATEVVHVGGFNVFPAEVESFLLTHPGIAHAAVLGVAHRALGESLQAFVVPAGVELDAREVVRFARSGIAGYKVPYDVRIVDELPLLASGKPDRRELARSMAIEAVRG